MSVAEIFSKRYGAMCDKQMCVYQFEASISSATPETFELLLIGLFKCPTQYFVIGNISDCDSLRIFQA